MKKKILIVVANYYENIARSLLNSAKSRIKNKYIIRVINVPGAFEIPVTISKNLTKFNGFIALGCVIKGQTPHFDLICNSSFKAILDLSIIYNKPIGNGIITALNKKQAYQRSGKIKSKRPNKGVEAVNAILSILKYGLKKT